MTAQIPERLLYQGADLALCTEPLKHFTGMPTEPWVYIMPNSALSRCYLGTWAIELDRLYLKKLQRWKHIGDQLVEFGIEDLLPGFPDGVFAHWFHGELRCPRGALLKYFRGGFSSIYEEDVFLRVQGGVVHEERVVRNGTAEPGQTPGYQIRAMTTYGR